MNGNVYSVGQSLLISLDGYWAYRERERASALCIDEEQRRNREDDLNGTVAQGGKQRLVRGVAGVLEDGRAVERDDCNRSDAAPDVRAR